MKTVLIGVLGGILLGGLSLAQETATTTASGTTLQNEQQHQTPAAQPGQSTPAPASGALRIAPGSVIPVHLTKTIDAKKVKTGDQVEARVTQDLKT